jgi:hypothetical protein
VTTVACFFEIGARLGRQHLAGMDYSVHAESAITLVEAYADHELSWAEQLTALAIWEHTGGPHATN